jgi:hypothetical protein
MQRKTRRIIIGVALIAAVAAGGAAFTASNSFPNGAPETGFGQVTVSGATVDSVSFSQTSDKYWITGATLQIAGDVTANHTIEAGWGDDGSMVLYSCTPGAFANGDTTVTCDFTAAPASGTAASTNGEETDLASHFDVTVNAT